MLVGLVQVVGVIVERVHDADEVGGRILFIAAQHESPLPRDHDVGASIADRLRRPDLRHGADDAGRRLPVLSVGRRPKR